METERVIERFLTQMPNRFDPVDKRPGDVQLRADHIDERHGPRDCHRARGPRGGVMPSTADLHTAQHDLRRPPDAHRSSSTSRYRNGVRIMSLTDHDIVDGLPGGVRGRRPASATSRLIPGIEMSTDVPGNEVHILGHFIDWQDEAFRDTLCAAAGVPPGPGAQDGGEAG